MSGVLLLLPLLVGCGKEENSPEMGAVAPKPNLSAAANAPGGAPTAAQPGADAALMGRTAKNR